MASPSLASRTFRILSLSVVALVAATVGESRAYAAPCASSNDCSATPSTPVCDPTSHECVACLLDYQQLLPKPLSCPTAEAPACQRAGILLGQCTQCSSTNATLCTTADEPVCNTTKGQCGCVTDDDCGAQSGRVCDAAQGTAGMCVAGCRVTAGKDSCPVGQVCSAQDGGVGTCSATQCTSDQNCSAPAPKCDLGVSPNHCVQCLADTDCTGGLVCDTTSGPLHGQCEPCATGKTSGCGASGTACLPDDTCGCYSDTDCGSTTSGRVCDGSARACQDGCRGSGGNGCPNGQVCTSTDDTIGQCVAGDGGLGDGGFGDGGNGGDGGLGGGGADAGRGAAPDDTLLEGGGCSCHVGISHEQGGAVVALFSALGLVMTWRRRRQRR